MEGSFDLSVFGFDARTRALLDRVARLGSVAAAARALGFDPSNARRHLATASRRTGAALVVARRGGWARGHAALTPAGRRLLERGALVARAGAYDAAEGVTPLRFGRRVLHVAGRVGPGPVEVDIDPAAVVLARAAPGLTSARNAVPARVDGVAPTGEGTFRVALAWGSVRLAALVTRGAVRDLKLRPGARVVAAVKATAIRARSLGP